MTSEAKAKENHERLFHLAAFFRDHGWVMPLMLRFNAGTRRWEGAFTGETPPVFTALFTQVAEKQLMASWVRWWESLPTLSPDFKNTFQAMDGAPCFACWGAEEELHGEDDYGPRAIRNAVCGLLKQAKTLRKQLKVNKFGAIYGMNKMPSPAEDALWNRVEAVLAALKPNTSTGIPADAAVDELFPHEGKKKWFGQGYFKHHDSNPKSLADIFGPEKAAEMKAAEDAALGKPAWDEEPKDAPAKYYEDKDPDAGED